MNQKTDWQNYLNSYSHILHSLEQQLNNHLNCFTPFRTLFSEIFKATDKFVSSLLSISQSIDQQILSSLSQSEKNLIFNYQQLRSVLISVVQNYRQISFRSRNQIIQPMKIFSDNYKKLFIDCITRLKKQLDSCLNAETQMLRCKVSYYNSCDKLQSHKQSQAKLMLKIQSGETTALQKFNKTTRYLLQRVSNSQRGYSQSVQRTNNLTNTLKDFTSKHLTTLRQNQISRVQFMKKTADCQIKILNNGKHSEFFLNQTQKIKNQFRPSPFKESLTKMQKWIQKSVSELFISHQEVIKCKKQKQFEYENPLLAQLFQRIKQTEKSSIRLFTTALIQLPPGVKLVSLQRPPRQGRLVIPPQWQSFKQKISSISYFCFYFCYLLGSQILDLPHYYIKLSTPYFKNLYSFLRNIIQFLSTKIETRYTQISTATIYQVLKIAQRVVQHKDGKVKVRGIKSLIQDLGTSPQLKNIKLIQRIAKYLFSKSQTKKSQKGGLVNFTKGLLSTFSKKEQEVFTEQSQFNILVEMTQLMSKLPLPSETVLSYLKRAVNQNQASYQYLKDMLLSKRDREKRQKIFQNQNIRFKPLTFLKQTSLSSIAQASLLIVSQFGFFSQKQISLRQVCRRLMNIHLNIIFKSCIPNNIKWNMISQPSFSVNYIKFNGNSSFIGPNSQVQDIIALDVQRSFQIHYDNLPPNLLKQFLIFYARQNPEMPYCQGMNYIAGFFLLKCPKTLDAYRIFKYSMNKLFLPVFKDNFSGMRIKLYIIDRLLSIFHPDIYDHLKKQMITPQCYAVSWIITAFSSVYQYTKTSFLIDWFWQRFLLWGWTQFYRLILWLFQLNRDFLIGASYDKCLQIFGQLTRCLALTAQRRQDFIKICSLDLEGAFDFFAVSNDLIDQIQKEHAHQ